MTISLTSAASSVSLRDRLAAIVSSPRFYDPLGLIEGLRAYRTYSVLNDKSDSELTAMGLKRADVARVAFGLKPLED